MHLRSNVGLLTVERGTCYSEHGNYLGLRDLWACCVSRPGCLATGYRKYPSVERRAFVGVCKVFAWSKTSGLNMGIQPQN